MKTALAALIAATLSVSAALADPSKTIVFQPLAQDPVTETVRRAAPDAVEIGRTALPPANVADVDVNGDGKISFAELLLHDVAPDF